MKHVSVSREGRIAVVRFDRGKPANPLSYELMRELTETARSFETDSEYANALASTASHADFDQYALAQSGADFAEGVQAFLEKRPPRYGGA